jgi:hypothetical protein
MQAAATKAKLPGPLETLFDIADTPFMSVQSTHFPIAAHRSAAVKVGQSARTVRVTGLLLP